MWTFVEIAEDASGRKVLSRDEYCNEVVECQL